MVQIKRFSRQLHARDMDKEVNKWLENKKNQIKVINVSAYELAGTHHIVIAYEELQRG